MKINTLSLALTVALVGSLPVYSQKQSPGAKRTTAQAKTTAALRVNPSFVSARKSFDVGDPAGSAAHLKAASTNMRSLVAKSPLPAATGVTSSAAELDKLASFVAQGKLKDGATLNQAFASAHQHMAVFQHAKATALLAEKKNIQAGQAMDRTADHVELASQWSGRKLDASQNVVVKGLRNAAGGLISGTGAVVEGTGTVLKKGLGLITGLGKTIQGGKKATSGNLGKDAVDGSRKVTGGAVKGVGKAGETGAGAVEKTGTGIKKLGDKVSGKEKK